jgi:phospholipid-binding lipoprotein MlaA
VDLRHAWLVDMAAACGRVRGHYHGIAQLPASLLVVSAAFLQTPQVSAEPVLTFEPCATGTAAKTAAAAAPPTAGGCPAQLTATAKDFAPDLSATPASAQPSDGAPAAGDGPQAAGDNAIVVTGRGKPPPTDPLQNANLKSFQVVQGLDKAVVGPVAMGYARAIPSPVRLGIHNVLVLLDEPTVIANFVLQHKFGRAAKATVRTVINATFGLAGLIDIAGKPGINIQHEYNGFSNTLGFYGVGSGPYLFLPLIGSTSVRDFSGRMIDLSFLSFAVGGHFSSPYYAPTRGVLASLDDRVEFDAELRRLRDESPDGYTSIRKYYLDRRNAEIAALRAGKPLPYHTKQ